MANSILQGTTPTLRITINPEDLLLSNATDIELTFQEQGKTECRHPKTIIKHISDVEVDTTNNQISYHFSQKETMDLDPEGYLLYQLRVKMSNQEIFGTTIKKINNGSYELMYAY